MIVLETDRLTIRNFRTGDWEALHRVINQYVASGLAAYEPHKWSTSIEEIRKITEWFASGDSFFAVCLRNGDRFIGLVALNQEQEDRVFNLGYVFDFDYHGKGYATEGCQAVLNHAFDKLRAERVVTGTANVNTRSIQLLERLGFKRKSESSEHFEISREIWKTKS